MNVEILYFAEFKEITKKDKEYFDSVDNLKDLIIKLNNKYPNIKKLIWDERAKKLRNSISIVLNHEAAHNVDLSKTLLSDGDKVAFLLPISGG